MKQFLFLALIVQVFWNSTAFSQKTAKQNDTTEQWKNSVLEFIHSNLERLYYLDSDSLKIELLEDFEEFIVQNDNGNHYRIGPNSILFHSWFEELGYLKLFPEVIRLDSVSLRFNGFKFLFRISTIYDSMIEQSEVISADLGYLAYRNPSKFLKFIESFNEVKEIHKIAGTPFWKSEGMDDFKKAISKSKYYNEISEMLLN